MCETPCNGCPLFGRDSIGKLLPDAKPGGVLLVGNFPDAGSVKNPKKEPFNGYKTRLLRYVVNRVKASIPREKRKPAYYAYACLCNPEFDKATKRYAISSADFSRCSVYLKSYMDIQKPDAIVALGVDVYRVLGLRGNVGDRRGRPAKYASLNGREIPVVCTFDLGTVLKQQGILNLFQDDIASAFMSKDTDLVQNVARVLTDPDEIVAALEEIDANVSGAANREKWRRTVAFDTETTATKTYLPGERVLSMSFSNKDNEGIAFPFMHKAMPFSPEGLEKVKAAVRKVLTNQNAIIVMANGKFDMQWLWSHGIFGCEQKWDVILAEHVLDEDKKGNYSLKDLTRLRFPRYGNYEDELDKLLEERWAEKDREVKELRSRAKDGLSGNLSGWWVSLTDSERESLLAEWVRRGVLEIGDTAGLSAVKTVKRNGVVGPSKKYLASAVRMLKKVPDEEFPEGVAVQEDIPLDLLRRTYEDIDPRVLLHYGAMDAICTRLVMMQQLRDMLRDQSSMRKFGRRTGCEVRPLFDAYFGITMPLSVEIARMEYHGIRFDREKATEYKEAIESRLGIVTDKIFSAVGYRFNPNSPDELSKVLYRDMKLPVLKYTNSGNPSTDEAVIEDLYDQNRELDVLDSILSYRRLKKTAGTYINNWLEMSARDGYIHAEFKQAGTATYRLSSSNPNLQNVPFYLNLPDGGQLNLKSLFLPDEGYDIYDLDIRNAEMRVLCGYSRDENLTSAFNDGKDLHALTASGISGIPYEQILEHKNDKSRIEYRQRQVAKKVNFGTVYCMQGGTLKTRLWEDCRIDVSEQEAQQYLDSFFKTYPGVADYVHNTKDFVDENAFVYTFFGRRRRFPYASYMKNDREHIRRQAVNARIQSTSSDMVMLCLLRVAKRLRERNDGSCVLLTVHDSILFQAPHGAHVGMKAMLDEEVVNETARQCPWLPVRWEYDCEWGPNYGDKPGEIQ